LKVNSETFALSVIYYEVRASSEKWHLPTYFPHYLCKCSVQKTDVFIYPSTQSGNATYLQ
jgi:hypothetical protein